MRLLWASILSLFVSPSNYDGMDLCMKRRLNQQNKKGRNGVGGARSARLVLSGYPHRGVICTLWLPFMKIINIGKEK